MQELCQQFILDQVDTDHYPDCAAQSITSHRHRPLCCVWLCNVPSSPDMNFAKFICTNMKNIFALRSVWLR